MKIGDKVVCVDDGPCRTCKNPIGLIKNQVYVVRGSFKWTNGVIYLQLLGFISKCAENHEWIGDTANRNRFRLLDEMKQEAANSQQQLTTSKH